ncbi:Hypothetical protein AA314_00364 [Archangium gephyra]|uniref:Uncharacterized protein n=1 Tax=Archangium gephyra TaxID=48 RepID=A0AAC8TAL5_9BACT|nr:Hypothetical protein AA314_00364 [Archangium gephyra]
MRLGLGLSLFSNDFLVPRGVRHWTVLPILQLGFGRFASSLGDGELP